MSVYITASLWEHSPHGGSELVLLLAMADQSLDDGVCDLTVDSLAQRTRLSPRTVLRLLQSLEDAGAISRAETGRGSTADVTYRIDVPGPAS